MRNPAHDDARPNVLANKQRPSHAATHQVKGDSPRVLAAVDEKLSALRSMRSERNQSSYDLGLYLGRNCSRLRPSTFDRLRDEAKVAAGSKHNAESVENGIRNGQAGATTSSLLSNAKPKAKSQSDDRKRQRVRKVLLECVPVAGTLAENYLGQHRKIIPPESDDIFFHRDLPVFNDPDAGKHPALVCRFRNARSGDPIEAIGVVYLDAEGRKATNSATKAKLSLGERIGR